jgi:hypothetical protein
MLTAFLNGLIPALGLGNIVQGLVVGVETGLANLLLAINSLFPIG